MRAFVVDGPHSGGVVEVPDPVAAPGEVVVSVTRVGLCGTDIEFWTGEMAYLHQGHATYPLRLGHEWAGVVRSVGSGTDPSWLGRRVTGDTMLGCGRCARCRSGRHNVCADRTEIGIRGGRPGALAELLAVPASALIALPDSVDDATGALVEPGGNAMRAVQAAAVGPGDRLLVLGAGAIGTLAALFALSDGAQVHLVGRPGSDVAFGSRIGLSGVWTRDTLPDLAWDAVIDASNDPDLPAFALDVVEPGGRLVYIGLAGRPSLLDTRTLVLKDVVATGVLAASQGLAGAVAHYARPAPVEPRSLVRATIGLSDVATALAGDVPRRGADGPKVQVDPSR